MDTICIKVVDGKHYNRFSEELINCRLCDNFTTMLGTKLCDRCWELETRIKGNLRLAKRIIATIEIEEIKEKGNVSLANLIEADKGRWVECVQYVSHDVPTVQRGRIKSWNDQWVFVVYKCDDDWDDYMNYTGCATAPEDLIFIEKGE